MISENKITLQDIPKLYLKDLINIFIDRGSKTLLRIPGLRASLSFVVLKVIRPTLQTLVWIFQLKRSTIFVRSKYHTCIKNVALAGDKVSPYKLDGPDIAEYQRDTLNVRNSRQLTICRKRISSHTYLHLIKYIHQIRQ